jgi:hypothetical protein
MKRTHVGRSAARTLTASLVVTLIGAHGCMRRPVVAADVTTKKVVLADLTATRVDKIDLLFMIDNSASMGDKQELLAEAVPDLLGRLLRPSCVDTKDTTVVVGESHDGVCDRGKLEFRPIEDIHVAVISSSIGDRGSQESCPLGGTDARYPQLAWHYDDRAHLLDRAGADGHPLADATPGSFLAWLPTTADNAGKPAPPVPAIGDGARLVADFGDLVTGVGQYGCFFEAQNEAWYRFLVQPDPERSVRVDGGIATLDGVDDELLAQRHDFLRPDSLVAVIAITDENESTVDPRSVRGEGHRFESRAGAPRATPICATSPEDPGCMPCPLAPQGTAGCENPFFGGTGANGVGDPDDPLNVRFFHMKERFGVDPRYPAERYVTALTSKTVPNRTDEHPPGQDAYAPVKSCNNPLFAAALPRGSSEETCKLAPGTRAAGQIFFAAITGVPGDLLHFDPASPSRSRLTDADWTKILGQDPERYDFTGIDPRMRESIKARAGRPTAGPDRDWPTGGFDLQYACTFDLKSAKVCDGSDPACDCGKGATSPLCDDVDQTVQRRAKAYPGVRHLELVKGLGAQGIASSICPADTKDARPENALYGYRPAVKAIVDALKGALTLQCLPEPLVRATGGEAPCRVLEVQPGAGSAADPSACDHPEKGRSPAAPDVVRHLLSDQAALGHDYGGRAVCEVTQLLPPGGASCVDDGGAGWCYVEGDVARAATGTCGAAVVFSTKGDPPGAAHVFLQCIESASAAPTP